ncbi:MULTISPECIES: AIR synthase-related protein [Mediterraneibacter]|jgi:hydrogenase expression/formation protein HypE|uniref:AIR synthase-related protein n=1 Tax=Mediterraneibacter TaxID=2316020 RepID=UPI000E490C38|nr:AIR synthase-related protein [Mediterraneibacter massiliensis]RGT75083.1 hydrogenase expression/formation protein HypE [Ruminococcus sp. AF18-22]
MKVGNLSQTVWRRDIKKKIQARRKEILFPLSAEENVSMLKEVSPKEAPIFAWAQAAVGGEHTKTGVYAILRAAGDLAAKGAEPVAVSAQILSPLKEQEENIVRMAAAMEKLCEKLDMQITCIRAEGSPSVCQTVVHVTAAGICREDVGKEKIKGDREILLCGYAGLEGTLLIEAEAKEELGERFTPSFLRQTESLEEMLCTPSVLLEAYAHGASAVRQIGSGGILAGLWDLSESLGIGMEIERSHILIRQETVEICEYYQLNPYQMTSAGSALIVTDKSAQLLAFFKRAGIRAGRLGVATDGKDRVITSGTEKRYLDRPAPDEWLRWQSERMNQKK